MPRFQAVLFDFFGTLTHGARRGAAHIATAELLGCSPEALMEVLDSSFYERASGSFGNAESTMRWVCARIGVHPSDAAVRAAVATRHRAVRADARLRAEAVPVLATLRYFRHEYLAHVRDHQCEALQCGALVDVKVDHDKCIKCKLCVKTCPVGAISADDIVVDNNKCTRCNSCIEVCPKKAISRVKKGEGVRK